MSTKMKFKCTSCQHIFEHDAYQKECFCPKCGNTSERCAEEEQFIVCSECGTEIPNGATSCPHAGAHTLPRKIAIAMNVALNWLIAYTFVRNADVPLYQLHRLPFHPSLRYPLHRQHLL